MEMCRPIALRGALLAVLLGQTLVGASAIAAVGEGEVAVPKLSAWVTDLAGILDPGARRTLESALQRYEQQTGHQFALLIMPNLGDPPESIDGFAIRVAEQWRLGDKKREDGLILVVALAERRVRVEVGYGLEGAIPDALAARIIREAIVPAFKQQDFAGGIGAGLSALMSAAGGEAVGLAQPAARRPQARGRGSARGQSFIVFLLIGAVLMLMMGRGGRGGRGGGGFLSMLLLGSLLGGGRSFGGGGFGGGGFGGGGFGGGGGGGFGGGGASGGW